MKRNKEDFKKPSGLTSEFFSKITFLEQSFYDNKINPQGVYDLVQLYAQAVEYYDTKKDLIKQYFLQKIQFTLSRHQILQQLRGDENQQNINQQKTIKEEDEFDEEQISSPQQLQAYQNDRFSKINKIVQAVGGVGGEEEFMVRPSVQKRKLQTDYKINSQLDEQLHQIIENKEINNILNQYEEKDKQHDVIKQSDIKTQVDQVQQRLLKRKLNLRKNFKQSAYSFAADDLQSIPLQINKVNIEEMKNQVETSYEQMRQSLQRQSSKKKEQQEQQQQQQNTDNILDQQADNRTNQSQQQSNTQNIPQEVKEELCEDDEVF